MPVRLLVVAAATVLGGLGFATHASASASVGQPAQLSVTVAGGIGSGSGRLGANVAALIGLFGAAVGGVALARSRHRGNGSGAAVVALTAAPIGIALAVVHLVTTTGGFGTGNGRAGAIVAVVVGVIGTVLGGLARSRSRRTG